MKLKSLLAAGREIPEFLDVDWFRYRVIPATDEDRWHTQKVGTIHRVSFGVAVIRFEDIAYKAEIWEYLTR